MLDRDILESLYSKYTRREMIFPDPVGFLYEYQNPLDREIVALVVSSLAYGRVAQINKSVSLVLDKLGVVPHSFLLKTSEKELFETFQDFKHRFTTGHELSHLLINIKYIVDKHGSLNQCFNAYYDQTCGDLLSTLTFFTEDLQGDSVLKTTNFIPSPAKGSACKRLNLFLRWMVRSDDVDPGGWEHIPTSKLLYPVDAHIHKLSLRLGLTTRRNADMKAAVDITEAFRKINPKDPVKYDFCLTKSSMMNDPELCKMLEGKVAQ